MLNTFALDALQEREANNHRLSEVFRYGVEGGVNISYPKESDEAKIDCNIGVVCEYVFTDNVFAECALKPTSKPFLTSVLYEKEHKSLYNFQGTPYYLNVPLHVGYRFNKGDKANFLFSAGPYLGIGLLGKGDYSEFLYSMNQAAPTTVGSQEFTNTYITNVNLFNDANLRRFEVGVTGKVSTELSRHYRISLEYNYQLNKMFKKFIVCDGHNQTFALSIGYMF